MAWLGVAGYAATTPVEGVPVVVLLLVVMLAPMPTMMLVVIMMIIVVVVVVVVVAVVVVVVIVVVDHLREVAADRGTTSKEKRKMAGKGGAGAGEAGGFV